MSSWLLADPARCTSTNSFTTISTNVNTTSIQPHGHRGEKIPHIVCSLPSFVNAVRHNIVIRQIQTHQALLPTITASHLCANKMALDCQRPKPFSVCALLPLPSFLCPFCATRKRICARVVLWWTRARALGTPQTTRPAAAGVRKASLEVSSDSRTSVSSHVTVGREEVSTLL